MTGLAPEEGSLTAEELQLATRNRGVPLEQPWNYQGLGNNLVQTVPVTVRP
jgi:hypothetical protein